MDAFLLIPLQTKFGSILVYIGINLSIRLSVCLKKKFKIHVCSIYFNEKHWNSLLQIDRFWPEGVSWTWPRVSCARSRLLLKMHNSRLDHILLWKMRSLNLTQRLLDTMWPVNALTLTFGQLYKVNVKMVHSLLLNTM